MKRQEEPASLHFLGPEFLLWLCWRSTEDTYYYIKEHGLENVDLVLEEQITLESLTGEGYRETITTQAVAEHDDVRASLRVGRIPIAARVKAWRGSAEWRFVLTAHPIAIRSVQLPAGEKNGNDEDVAHLRIAALEEIERIMRAIFAVFLVERTNKTFVAALRGFLGLE